MHTIPTKQEVISTNPLLFYTNHIGGGEIGYCSSHNQSVISCPIEKGEAENGKPSTITMHTSYCCRPYN